ncbi:DotA/TraY family protein [Agrobacterium tumefaciens]|uniref:DotA/TraY family protein n=1 Tax=Agrobacterium tumefaciens TaxID=358 RepID=UPI001573F161|nr:DotA/TraY family protein [Agrobacterium tumefaciens]NTE01540.1 DotA/TraY family protein [Agrobacterium tumefaciens]NTE11800.1 DotA/TraY family protein [Agrobacterium tumefaciens]NTE31986.1 DotA/TraY family protein [Agrobacterium tumefaciens]
MAKPDDISGMFTPEDYSASLVFLRRLLGCTFDYVWAAGGGATGSNGGACDNTNDILALLIETMNWAMLAVVAVVATYLIFASLKDTANDGEAGGRSTNPSWTLVLAGIGAILCFPAFNGFNALQLGTMQVAVWSAGLGDTTWRVAAEKMATANTVNAAFSSKADDGWFYSEPSTEKALREQIAAGLATRVAGEVCRVAISKGTSSMATPDGAVTTVTPPPTFSSETDGYTQTVLTYKGGKGLDDSSGLCGSVTVSYASERQISAQSAGSDLAPGNSAAQVELARSTARFQAQAAKAGGDALLQAIRTEGDGLYQKLFPENGQRLRGQAQLNAIQSAVTGTIDRAKTAMQGALKQAPAEFRQHTNAAMTGNQKNGWLYAVLYQRVLVNATTSLSKLGLGGVEVLSNQPVEDLQRAFGCGGWFENGCSNELQVFFDAYKRDTLALAEIAPAFRNAAQNSAIQGVNSATIGNANSGGVSLSKSLNDILLDLADVEPWDGQGWIDPIPQLQATGAKIMTYGSGVLVVAGAGSAASALGKHPAVMLLGELASHAAPLGWLLFAIGFMLAVIVPYMPLVYFFLAAISWFVLAVQTIITAPFWLMQMFYPNRNGGIAGTSVAKVLSTLLALLVRPALIIVGLVFCMIMMRVGLDILNFFAANAFIALAPNTSGLNASIGDIGLAIGGFFVYMSSAVFLVTYCCSLIDGVSDFVMEMVESGASRMLGSQRDRSDSVLGNPTSAMAAGLLVGSSRSRGQLAGSMARLKDMRSSKSRGNLGGTQK